jgi:16S rRNA (uracil1498-N3)-methyltransferase
VPDPRFFVDTALTPGLGLELPEAAARHVQVLRAQPGTAVTLFNGQGGEWRATVTHMGRKQVLVEVGTGPEAHQAVERETAVRVHLALGMPANERMDWLVEKAAELGVASIQPLLTERAVLRLHGDRALKRQQHWQAVAQAACEQCGRNRVPHIHAVTALEAWLAALTPNGDPSPAPGPARWLLSLSSTAQALSQRARQTAPNGAGVLFLSGPEGGLSDAEAALARGAGFLDTTLGPQVLRAETAALAALAGITALVSPP